MSVRIHPAVTAAQLHALTARHGLLVRYEWRGGRPAVYAEPAPRPVLARAGWEFACERCDWEGSDPILEPCSTHHPIVGEVLGEIPRCPACSSYSIVSRVAHVRSE